MKKISRILGALSSALIIVSVFVPFRTTGVGLWEAYNAMNALYLPIMIIVFGVIGVIFFSLNVKTEFAYMSTGAIAFFIIMNTIDVLNDNTFSTLGIGYYLLAVGSLLTGIMAFVSNLKKKDVLDDGNKENSNISPAPVLDQTNDLHNYQNANSIVNAQQDNNLNMTPIEPVNMINNNVEQSISTDNLNGQVSTMEQPIPIQPQMNQFADNQVSQLNQNIVEQPINPSVQFEPIQPQVVESPIQVTETQQPTNSVLQEFNQPSVNANSQVQNNQQQIVNPVLQEFNQPSVDANSQAQNNQQQIVNPVLQEFNQTSLDTNSQIQSNQQQIQPMQSIEVQTPIMPQYNQQSIQQSNPVLQEFNQPSVNNQLLNNNQTSNPVIQDFGQQMFSTVNQQQQIQPQNLNTNNDNDNSLNIFGQ